MAETADPTTEPEDVQPVDEPQGDPALEDAGKKALTSERRARAAAEKKAKTLQEQLDAINAEKLTAQEKAVKDAEDARSEATAAKAEALQQRYARTVPDITDEEVELFLTGRDEETLARQAEALRNRNMPPSKGSAVPGVGNKPQQPPNLDEQIRLAESEGNHSLAMTLKTQKLAGLARN